MERTATVQQQVMFAESIEIRQSLVLVGELARLMQSWGIDTGQKRLFAWMRREGYLDGANMPTAKAQELGLFEVKHVTFMQGGWLTHSATTMVTPRGQRYFIEKLTGRL